MQARLAGNGAGPGLSAAVSISERVEGEEHGQMKQLKRDAQPASPENQAELEARHAFMAEYRAEALAKRGFQAAAAHQAMQARMHAGAEQAESAKVQNQKIRELEALTQLVAKGARMRFEHGHAELAEAQHEHIRRPEVELHAQHAQMSEVSAQAKQEEAVQQAAEQNAAQTAQVRQLEGELHAKDARMQAEAELAEAAKVKQIQELQAKLHATEARTQTEAEQAEGVANEYQAQAQMQAEEKLAEEHMADDTRDADLGSQQAEDSLEDEEDLQGAEKDEREHRGDEDSVQKRARHA